MKQIWQIVLGLAILFLGLDAILVARTPLIPSIVCLLIATAGLLWASVAWGKWLINHR